jgi:hypothetical protein
LHPFFIVLEYELSKINFVSDYEYAQLIAMAESTFNDQYDCNKCLNRYKDIEMVNKTREMKSCEVTGVPRFKISDTSFSRCPGNLTNPSTSYLLGVYNNYDKWGALPENGSYFEQSFKMTQIISIIDSVVADNRKKQRDKESKKVRKK